MIPRTILTRGGGPLIVVLGAVAALVAACGSDPIDPATTVLSGVIEIDGSSTVFPITSAVAEEFKKLHDDVNTNVGVSGTGGGFKRFTAGETDISNASRPIKESEAEAARENGIEFYQMKAGIDGLSVIVHPDNDFAACLTVEELKMIWQPFEDEAGEVVNTLDNWSQVRPGFPDEEIRLYGPDTDSGTFDYFTEEIVGEAQSSRSDYTASANDNVLVQGVGGDRSALGYFGYAYYIESTDRLKAVAIDSGDGCVAPTAETIESGAYTPLARSLFIYVNKKSIARPEVAEFLRFYMEKGAELARDVGYIPEAASTYTDNLAMAGLQ